MINSSTGGVVNNYEYSPFGKLINEVEAIENPFKFSSEFADSETNLVYYNYRYYNPELGRWLSRDPIQEKGGYNLYDFCRNAPICYIDVRGQFALWGVLVVGVIAIAIVYGVKIYIEHREKMKKYEANVKNVLISVLLNKDSGGILISGSEAIKAAVDSKYCQAIREGLRTGDCRKASGNLENCLGEIQDKSATIGFSGVAISRIVDKLDEALRKGIEDCCKKQKTVE